MVLRNLAERSFLKGGSSPNPKNNFVLRADHDLRRMGKATQCAKPHSHSVHKFVFNKFETVSILKPDPFFDLSKPPRSFSNNRGADSPLLGSIV